MYKTIRHGENSLQYTILPQNDDFRIEGKLSSAGSSCSSASSGAASSTGRKCKAKRPKRRSFFAYLGLIFVCTVIVGAVLIPFLVSAECLPSPTEWFLKTKAALTKGAAHKSAELRVTARNDSASADQQRDMAKANAANIGKMVQIINSNGVEKIILKTNKTRANANQALARNGTKVAATADLLLNGSSSSNGRTPNEQATAKSQSDAQVTVTVGENVNDQTVPQPAAVENFVTEVRFEQNEPNQMAAIAPTIVVTTLRSPYVYEANNNNINKINSNSNINNVNADIHNESPTNEASIAANAAPPANAIRPTTSFSTTSIYSPHAPAGATNGVNASPNASAPAMPTIVTRIIQVPLLKSTAKKPIIPPALIRTSSELAPKAANNAAPATVNSNATAAAAAVATTHAASAVQPQSGDWLQSHWPYIDPSSYFQWTGYKQDSVLLPALLGFALIGMILIITVCLVARNKRAIVSSVRKRNRNDVEETGAEDNATLLTTTSLSDED